MMKSQKSQLCKVTTFGLGTGPLSMDRVEWLFSQPHGGRAHQALILSRCFLGSHSPQTPTHMAAFYASLYGTLIIS